MAQLTMSLTILELAGIDDGHLFYYTFLIPNKEGGLWTKTTPHLCR